QAVVAEAPRRACLCAGEPWCELALPQMQELAVLREPASVLTLLRAAPVEARAGESRLRVRIGDTRPRFLIAEGGELRELVAPALAHRVRELVVEIAEEQERL